MKVMSKHKSGQSSCAYNEMEVVTMKEARIEIRHYSRSGEMINVSSDEFRMQVQRITEAVIKKLLDMP